MSVIDPSNADYRDISLLLERISNITIPDLDSWKVDARKDGVLSRKYGSYEELIVVLLRSCSNVPVLQLLLQKIPKAKELRIESGKSLLHIAAKENANAIFSLVEIGCDVNTRENLFANTALHVACCYGNLDAIFWLVQAGASVNLANGSGETPLDIFLSLCRNPLNNSMERSRLLIAHTLHRMGFKLTPKGKSYRRSWREKIQFAFNKAKRCSSVPSLQHICRLRVRTLMSSQSLQENVWKLDIPATLHQYLLYRPCALDRHVVCPHLSRELFRYPIEDL